MGPYLAIASEARARLVGMIELFNGGDVDAFMAQHSEDVAFSTPIWRSCRGGDAWRHGIAAHRDDVLGYREAFGRLRVVDVFPGGSSVSLAAEDERGNRTQFRPQIGANGLITSVFAFHVGRTAPRLGGPQRLRPLPPNVNGRAGSPGSSPRPAAFGRPSLVPV